MKAEIELNREVVEMLDRHREMRITHHTGGIENAPNGIVKNYHRNQVEFYIKAGYRYLAEEYLQYQAHFADKKTD